MQGAMGEFLCIFFMSLQLVLEEGGTLFKNIIITSIIKKTKYLSH